MNPFRRPRTPSGTRAEVRITLRRNLWTETYLEFLRPRTLNVGLAVVALVSTLMAVIGPFGTATLPLPRRVLFWTLPAVFMFPLCYSLSAAVLYLRRSASLLGMVPAIAIGVLIQSVAVTVTIHAVDEILRPNYRQPSMTEVFPIVVASLLLCSFFVHYVVFQRSLIDQASTGDDRSPDAAGTERSTRAAHADGRPHGAERGVDPNARSVTPQETDGDASRTPAAGPVVPQPERRSALADREAFFQRLSRTVSRDVIYIKVEDHYVDVHTTNGSCLVLMTFSKAMASLGDLGVQTHRSYWVATRHVLGIVRRDGATMVRVTGGDSIPVSRSFLPRVRDAIGK